MKIEKNDGISVIMPTYNQGTFILRAISSLLLQTFDNWELIIIDDGSTDYTYTILQESVFDERIKIYSNKSNCGLGASINKGLTYAYYNLIAYLPSDDIYFKDHLSSLHTCLHKTEKILAYSGIAHTYNDTSQSSGPSISPGQISNESLQLVQVLHRKVNLRWMERDELVTENLGTMFWDKLCAEEGQIGTGMVTCEWVSHPFQRHKIINEGYGGGIHYYKQFYNVKTPLRFKSSLGNLIDEATEFSKLIKVSSPQTKRGLKILIVGELAYNPERILALEEQGHQLFGLWISNPAYYNTTGPLPFGNIVDITLDELNEKVEEIKPDIIYALLNHQAVPLAHYVLRADLGIPFVWHFKEGPFVCRQNGLWQELIELYVNADGKIFTNQETKDWFAQFLTFDDSTTFILDGDLPKKEWFDGDSTPLLSDGDGEIHTVITGRPYGIHEEHIRLLGQHKIHLHFYGNIQHAYWLNFIYENQQYAPGFLHLHDNCTPENWVKEFSRYDAGWLHIFDSENQSEYMKANWQDLNYPARISTLAAAGLPMILKNNRDHIVATQSLLEKLNIGIVFDTINDLCEKLRDKANLKALRMNLSENKNEFSFDFHADDLTDFFRNTIANYKK